jgi:signal transduction histidine kinase
MFASVSHELRTPVNSIINCLNCLSNSSTENNEKFQKWISIAFTSSQFLLSLINDTIVNLIMSSYLL